MTRSFSLWSQDPTARCFAPVRITRNAPVGTCDHIAEVIARHQQSAGERRSQARVPAIPELRKTATAWFLEHPFRVDQIKVKDGVKYIDGASVIQRLNDVLGTANWSFRILGEPIQLPDEVIIRGRLTAWIGDRKVIKEDFGAHEYARKKSDKSIISRSDTIKSATTDCIKHCAHQLGVGLHLYSKDGSFRSFRLSRAEAIAQPGSNPRPSAVNPRPEENRKEAV
jgi:hypothetical protein